MADRPQYCCQGCGYQWFPRGESRVVRCPTCRGSNVAPVMSLDDAEPDPPSSAPPLPPPERPSRLPKILALVTLGVVLHAIAGTLAVYLLRDNKEREPEVAAAKAPDPAPAPKTPRKEAGPPTVPPKRTPKETPQETVPLPPTPVEPDPPAPTPLPPMPTPKTPEPMPKTPEPAPKTPEPAPMPPEPAPKMPPERAVSPFPPPAGSWASDWEKAGDVRIRVAGVAESKVPLEMRKKKFLSAKEYFVVWVEVENTSKTDHKYNRWQPVASGECTLRYATGGVVAHASYDPPEASREWFTPFSQPLPAGGPPAQEALVFSPPDQTFVGPLTLSLDATRAGGIGRITIDIPRAVWVRR